MQLIEHIQELIEDPERKTLLQVGAHDDEFTKELARYFKKVYLYSEFVKISPYTKGNIDVKKISYKDLINKLNEFDVLYMDNEFHHLPDIYQMWTYEKLLPNQILIIKEWDTQKKDPYYKCFQDCRLLHKLTKEILEKFQKRGIINVEKVYQKESYSYESKESMIEYFKYVLPDHWKFGEKDLFELLKNAKFPIKINEGYFIYKVTKAV